MKSPTIRQMKQTAVYPGNRLITPAVRAFVEVLVAELRARRMGAVRRRQEQTSEP